MSALLVLAVFMVFGQTVRHHFVSYDDSAYIYENPNILEGFTRKSVAWAFTQGYAANWHPLTWLSHLLDFQLYGLRAGGHHLTSVVLHAINAVLLLLVLHRMTRNFWPSVFVAFVFAIHPLRAESVAWVAERKDVLSGFFWILTMGLYARYAERATIRRYLAVLLCFALGLMSKPMLVSLPFVLLLLDFWPLRRLDPAPGRESESRIPVVRRLILEKLPLLGLAALSSVITVIVQSEGEAVLSLTLLPFFLRLANALVAYVAYIGKWLWPTRLAVFYPHPMHDLFSWPVLGSLILLIGLSAIAMKTIRRAPYITVGWLWYLGTLVPVIGLMQVGVQAMADRYTYLTQIGLAIALAWGIADQLNRRPEWRRLAGVAATAVILLLMILAGRQTYRWKDTLTLFRHTLAVTRPNSVAHATLGDALDRREQVEEALEHYRKAVEIDPANADALYNWGNRLFKMGRTDEAIVRYQEAMRHASTRRDEIVSNLGTAYVEKGDLESAVHCFQTAMKINPNEATTHHNLGVALAQLQRRPEAIHHFKESVRLKPDDADPYLNLAILLNMEGQKTEAEEWMRKALSVARATNNQVVLEQIRKMIQAE